MYSSLRCWMLWHLDIMDSNCAWLISTESKVRDVRELNPSNWSRPSACMLFKLSMHTEARYNLFKLEEGIIELDLHITGRCSSSSRSGNLYFLRSFTRWSACFKLRIISWALLSSANETHRSSAEACLSPRWNWTLNCLSTGRSSRSWSLLLGNWERKLLTCLQKANFFSRSNLFFFSNTTCSGSSTAVLCRLPLPVLWVSKPILLNVVELKSRRSKSNACIHRFKTEHAATASLKDKREDIILAQSYGSWSNSRVIASYLYTSIRRSQTTIANQYYWRKKNIREKEEYFFPASLLQIWWYCMYMHTR